ncbi:VOC family protein [Brachymonas denitrificans]|uniref:Glyoxalase superfamily enzyme, possibly 3-demethylubiquinone-9 3-methyltransferase n=1 Tax=Brachymonas denitrificans DSM 15123 TaxID=1121117 RepID=A0A1H8J6T7_9BURK|nr:VOC family protein [Brachymonas denitrificans]SEN76653.1 Glyoxalase superfamily enzyme, possibly 3-demethylubiquinone-9 3-methyltransferase [Brachymonas denitrificans DSM 15123]
MARLAIIQPCLWFDDQAEDAARFYTGIFPDSAIGTITRYTDVGQEHHGKPVGSVLTVAFTLAGQPFVALNGGPVFRFNEALSLQVLCETQDEVDHYWHHLSEGNPAAAMECGWLKDRFGLPWQVVPVRLTELLADPDAEVVRRVTRAMFAMQKMDIASLERAASAG